jgi:hypothetical protein
MSPPTVRLHHIDNRIEHYPSVMVIGSPHPFRWREQRFQAAPDHIRRVGRLDVSLPALWTEHHPLPLLVVGMACPSLMPPSPVRPSKDRSYCALHRQHQLPKEVTYLPTT